MIIEDKIPDKFRLDKIERINNNLIYLVDYEICLTEFKQTRYGKKKITRVICLKDEIHENNPGKDNKEYYDICLRYKTKSSKNEIMEIKKVILKKEIACSFYKR